MCGDPYGFMCDDCFGNMRESGIDTQEFTEEHLCKSCKESAKKYWQDDEEALELGFRKESAHERSQGTQSEK